MEIEREVSGFTESTALPIVPAAAASALAIKKEFLDPRICSFKKRTSTTPTDQFQVISSSREVIEEETSDALSKECRYRYLNRSPDSAGMSESAFSSYRTQFEVYFKSFESITTTFEKNFAPLTEEMNYSAYTSEGRRNSAEEAMCSNQSDQADSKSPRFELRVLPQKEVEFKNFVLKIFTNFLYRGKHGKQQPLIKTIEKPSRRAADTNHNNNNNNNNNTAATNSLGQINSHPAASSQLSNFRESKTTITQENLEQKQSQFHNLKNSFMHLIIQIFSLKILRCFDIEESIALEAIAVIERMKQNSFKYRPVKGRYQYYSNIHYSTLFLVLNSVAALTDMQNCDQAQQYHEIFFQENILNAISEEHPVIVNCNFYKLLIGKIVIHSIQFAEKYLRHSLHDSILNSSRYSYISKVTRGIQKLQKGKHVIRF